MSDCLDQVGWGIQGNQSVRPYGTQLLLRASSDARYPFGTGLTTGLVAAQVANPDLKWETSTQTNVGIERQLGSLAVGASYVGTFTRNLPFARDVNYPVATSTATVVPTPTPTATPTVTPTP